MEPGNIRSDLAGKGLRVTPQRVAILEAIISLNNHPTTDNIIKFIKERHPNIASGTVYKVLEILVDKGLIRQVKTDRDLMRYDAILKKHHHLYGSGSDKIEDYYDDELDRMLEAYFDKKKIKNFKIEDIKLQIIGKFKKDKDY